MKNNLLVIDRVVTQSLLEIINNIFTYSDDEVSSLLNDFKQPDIQSNFCLTYFGQLIDQVKNPVQNTVNDKTELELKQQGGVLLKKSKNFPQCFNYQQIKNLIFSQDISNLLDIHIPSSYASSKYAVDMTDTEQYINTVIFEFHQINNYLHHEQLIYECSNKKLFRCNVNQFIENKQKQIKLIPIQIAKQSINLLLSTFIMQSTYDELVLEADNPFYDIIMNSKNYQSCWIPTIHECAKIKGDKVVSINQQESTIIIYSCCHTIFCSKDDQISNICCYCKSNTNKTSFVI